MSVPSKERRPAGTLVAAAGASVRRHGGSGWIERINGYESINDPRRPIHSPNLPIKGNLQMKHFLAVGALVMVGPLSGCSTMMTAPPRHFLSETVESSPHDRSAPDVRRATVTIDPARAQIGEVDWLAETGADLTTGDQRQLVELLGTQLRSTLQKLPPAPGGRPVVVRAAITRVEPVSPALNTVSTLLLVAPWDRGGAATEIEAVDAETGKQLAAIRMGYFAPMSDIKARFIKLASAEIAIRKAVTDFSVLLTPVAAAAQIARP